MNKEIKAALRKIKDKLPKRGAYAAVVEASNGTLTLDIVKSTFTFRTKGIETIKEVMIAANAVIKSEEEKLQNEIDEIKRLASR